MTGRIFVILAAIAALVGLTGCNRQPVAKVSLPADVAAVTTPFLAAVRRGDQKAAEKFVAKGFVDDSRLQFAEMSALLKKSPELVPAINHRKPGALGPDLDMVMLTFATKKDGQWITSEIHMYEPEVGKFEIRYWDVNSDVNPPELLKHAGEMRQFMTWLMGGLGLTALFGLALLIWVIKRRTHIIAPEPVVETRRVAATVRDADG